MIQLALLSSLACAATQGGREPHAPERLVALWVTRFDYRTREDVVAAVESAAEAGFDTLLWQVRGNATAFYRSSFEPWAEQLGWRDPGFDPLAVALEEAHARGLALHAWVNVVPAWWGTELPASPDHLWFRRPEWFWYDQHGKRQAPSERFYVSLNPCLPEVRAYLADVIGEIAERYPVDGLHLDYLRFPNEDPAVPAGSGLDYPRDPGTLSLFRRATGETPTSDPRAWDAWRAEQVSELLRAIRARVLRARPGLPIGAAVGPEPERALHHFQDVRGWLREGLLELVFPMNYTADAERFDARAELWTTIEGEARVVMGVRLEAGSLDERHRQLVSSLERFDACAVFAHSSLFDSPNVTLDRQDEAARDERRQRRAFFRPILAGLAGATR